MRVGFFGGSFDPPHVGHVLAVAYAATVGAFERVLVVPVYEHAFDKSLSPFAQRVEMCRLAMLGLARVEVSTLEERLAKPNYTLETLREVLREHPDYELSLIAGTDVLADSAKWRKFDEVRALAPAFPLDRPGSTERLGSSSSGKVSLLPDVSSTRVRELLRRRREPEVLLELGRLVPAAVLSYIDQHGLYL
jgi:nicotinate-nucleotide adenylyltransferase